MGVGEEGEGCERERQGTPLSSSLRVEEALVLSSSGRLLILVLVRQPCKLSKAPNEHMGLNAARALAPRGGKCEEREAARQTAAQDR